ncbi:hypothetical protein CHY_2579 [Carboxydothermus hydrogenoformans Z-2901]|uniref:Uncharacterized protein n=1 Tax=Carboxydothermus hydrogenoformans (strain ATCC BAA-161 / DSM 6008 / Z-2901) TaxID=246194 RepID=Q3A912_CARHZ|nr:hypothetical protein CHY_2579 [Carboxydothermus hydrogenoformans Z-2901]
MHLLSPKYIISYPLNFCFKKVFPENKTPRSVVMPAKFKAGQSPL